MKADIEEILEKGKSLQQPEPAFNTAPVEPETLFSVLFPHSDFAAEITDFSMHPGETQLFIKFRPKFDQQNAICEEICLSLTVFDSFEHPISALTSHLLGFEAAPLKSFVKPCEVSLGTLSFCTQQSVFWVRGNQFIQIQEFSRDNCDYTCGYTSPVCDIATRLDNYLASYINRDDFGGPRASFSHDKLTVCRGQRFSMELIEIDTLLEKKNSSSDDPGVVLSGGAPSKEGVFEFYAIGAGKTRVRACIADAVTLRPGVASAEIVVEPADVVDTWAELLAQAAHQNEAELK